MDNDKKYIFGRVCVVISSILDLFWTPVYTPFGTTHGCINRGETGEKSTRNVIISVLIFSALYLASGVIAFF